MTSNDLCVTFDPYPLTSYMKHGYMIVLTKFSGTTGYPKNSVILPGNEVLFSLETASDYIKDVNEEKVLTIPGFPL